MLSELCYLARQVALEHPLETLIFCVLLWITINRRDLSSNRTYRKKKKYSGASVSFAPASPPISSDDLRQGMRILSMKVSGVSGRVRDIINNNATMLGASSGKLSGIPSPGDGTEGNRICSKSQLEYLLQNQDMCLAVYGCLSVADISSLSCTCRGLLNIHDPEFIWQQLWNERYGNQAWKSKVLTQVRQQRGIQWSPFSNWGPPSQGWKLFFMEYEYSWLDWLLAGANTAELCLLGYVDQVLDVTSFVEMHPGTPETLLDHAGGECSAMIDEIGHSFYARSLMKSFSINAIKKEQNQNDIDIALNAPIGSHRSGTDSIPNDSASEDTDDCDEEVRVVKPRSKLEARLELERVAALRIVERQKVTMYPVPATCGLKHKGKAYGHIKPVFGAPNSDPDDPFVVPSPAQVGVQGASMVRMCPVAVGPGVSQESFAPQVGPVSLVGGGASDMWNVVLSVISSTINSPASTSAVAFGEIITIRSSNKLSSQVPVLPVIANALLDGIGSSEFSCCELSSNGMWRRAADMAGVGLPSHNSDASGQCVFEYIFDASTIDPITAALFQELPPSVSHLGQPRVFYDPLIQEWTAWWTCCGISYALDQSCINRECNAYAVFSNY